MSATKEMDNWWKKVKSIALIILGIYCCIIIGFVLAGVITGIESLLKTGVILFMILCILGILFCALILLVAALYPDR